VGTIRALRLQATPLEQSDEYAHRRGRGSRKQLATSGLRSIRRPISSFLTGGRNLPATDQQERDGLSAYLALGRRVTKRLRRDHKHQPTSVKELAYIEVVRPAVQRAVQLAHQLCSFLPCPIRSVGAWISSTRTVRAHHAPPAPTAPARGPRG
jgi:hypothetical protein